MSAIILRDEIVHYEVLGRGRPLLFLHDWVGSWRYWIPSMQAASTSFRAYALDLWGFGDTAKKTNYYSIEQQIGLLAEFLNAMGIGKIALVGHGLGAIISLLYTSRNPGHVDRFMAIGLPQHENAISPRLRSSPTSELADWLLDRNPNTEAIWVEASKADQKAILLSLTTLQDLDLPSLPGGISTPCLLVYGGNDPAISPPSPENISNFPEVVHFINLEKSAHYPMLDQPSKFNRLLSDFLSLASGESPRQLQLKEEWKRRVR
ncbi:MAG: alpha/beta hydrolase [Anaerolineales bacterium]|jgi:pimeloyl-ACP methyl ester carboxylesterase